MDRNLVILTGAGISAESGLGTFRDVDGLWTRFDLGDVATPEGFARNPALVHEFYNARRENCRGAVPNAAHEALVGLQRGWTGGFLLVTQNIDDLHERAGSRDVVHMHGSLNRALCAACAARWDAPEVVAPGDACPDCGARATRPDVVWFGEIPYHMERIGAALADCDLFVAIGTSGQVYPAAGFVAEARGAGAETVEINIEPAGGFDREIVGPASRSVPEWVAEVTGAAA